jgi:phosphoenolpyruvate carboxykinase (GTP)
MTENKALRRWVEETALVTKPDQIVWCDGSEEENSRLIALMLGTGDLIQLNPQTYPNCYLHRSNPTDVARTEHLTFICTDDKEAVGPTNNWMSPEDAKQKVWPLFEGAMRGRTMYVVPYLMGPESSPMSRVGVEITDSPYVVASMRIMTRMGQVALAHLDASDGSFVKGLHSLGDLSPDRRFICHFPKAREIWSVGSGYGGNALLGKKCFALRIASTMGRDEGWLAEHMLILGIERLRGPRAGETTYVAAAFPSACGKTNLAMLVPTLKDEFKVTTVGDDICWMHFGRDGRLWAINPEAGFFGVAPGTGKRTNSNALACLGKNSIFTNVAMTATGEPWWEGLTQQPPAGLIDWQGRPWTPELAANNGKAAQPNSRFTAPASQCPSISQKFNAPEGVPISAIIFGGRRARLAPLVMQARDWQHGVYMGATMASETTAAATGAVGVVRNDPMAMLPFCGYNMADYFGHWLDMGSRTSPDKLPQIFHVNWFRVDDEGKFLWPGYGDNIRVLSWIIDRVSGDAEAHDTPIGQIPTPSGLDLRGLNLPQGAIEKLLTVDVAGWREEADRHCEFLTKFGARLPPALWQQHATLVKKLET